MTLTCQYISANDSANESSQLTVTCSMSPIETPEKVVKYIQSFCC